MNANIKMFFVAIAAAIACAAARAKRISWEELARMGESNQSESIDLSGTTYEVASTDELLIWEAKADAPLVDKHYNRPILSSKVIRIENKVRKPPKVEKIIKANGREFDESDPKAYDKFWAAPLEEKKKYPRTLRRKFVHTHRYRRQRAEEEKLKAENPKEFVKQKRAKPPKVVPYTEEEIEILGSRDRRLTVGEVLYSAKSGKISNQTKIGNKTINLEVQ